MPARQAWLLSHGTCPNCRVRAQDGAVLNCRDPYTPVRPYVQQ